MRNPPTAILLHSYLLDKVAQRLEVNLVQMNSALFASRKMLNWTAVVVLLAVVTALPAQRVADHPNHFSFDDEVDSFERQGFSLKEKCHAKVLQTCGVAVIEGFGIADLSLEEKCSIRQDFLECMIRLDKHSCSSRNVRDMDDKWINALRQQILQLLWSARGCVLGMEVA